MVNPQHIIGKQIEQFRIDRFIARGAMGMVFKAFDTVLARTVALKLISRVTEENHLTPQETALREEARKRLIQEAKAAGRLTHPNIVTVHSYGETDEFVYICMEYVPGKTLAQVLAEKKVLDTLEAITIFEQILQALDAASMEHIVHRDIKPSNIIMTTDDRVKVMDFGIAKLPTFSMTVTGTVLGTPYYMSPEQIAGQKVDIRSDIFSAGAVFYEAITGEKPFEGQNTAALVYQIINVEPIPPVMRNAMIPAHISDILRKAMAKDRTQRYQTPAEMLRDLMGAEEVVRGLQRGQEDRTVLSGSIPSGQPDFARATPERTAKMRGADTRPAASHYTDALPVEPEKTRCQQEKPKSAAPARVRAEKRPEPEEIPTYKPEQEKPPEAREVPPGRGPSASKLTGAAILFILVAGVALAVLYRNWNRPQPLSSPPTGQYQTRPASPAPGDHPAQSPAPPVTAPQPQLSQPPGITQSPQQEPTPPLRSPSDQYPASTPASIPGQPTGTQSVSPPTSGAPPGAAPVASPAAPPVPSGPELAAPSEKTQTTAVRPRQPVPKPDKLPERKAPKKDTPREVAPRHPRVTSFTEAKSAYADRKITADEYRTIVRDLKIAYAKEVEQLKLDFRSGRIDKAEYSRRAVQIKTKYR